MSVKDYKEGMVAGAKPFEEKFREIQNANIAALQKLCSENSNTIGELIDIAEEHDNLLNYEWKKNYELSSLAEKTIFLGFLKFCIRVIEGSAIPVDGQKSFFNNLCKTFQIDPFQIKEIEITKLKNNEDVSFQNLLYMSICNYFYISAENFKFEKKYNDDIFQYFRVSTNDKKEIHDLIEWTNNHLSLENIFDYENEQNSLLEEAENVIGCISTDNLEDFTINELLFIKKGNEQLFNNKKVFFDANIKVGGKVIFKNCYINYGLNDSIITVDENGELIFENCVFIYKNNNKTEYFITSLGNVVFKKSLFENCWGLCFSRNDIELENSTIIYNKNFFPKKISNSHLEYCLFYGECNIKNSSISGSNIEFSKENDFLYDRFYIFVAIKNCVQSIFENCIQPAVYWKTIIDSKFSNSKKIIRYTTSGNLQIQNSEFTACESILDLHWNSEKNLIENCKFINCYNCLIEMSQSKLCIKDCEFRNLKQNRPTSYILISEPKDNTLHINKTIFDDLSFFDFGYLIHIACDSKLNTMTKNDNCQILIEDCMFGKIDRKTSNPLIDKYCVCISQFVSKLSLKNVLSYWNNSGLDALLQRIQINENDLRISELETIVHQYLPKFGSTYYSKKDFASNKKAIKKLDILINLIPNLDKNHILGFVDLSVTGNINDYLVFTAEQCYFHYIDTMWTYYYNYPEISESAILYKEKNERLFFLRNSSVNDKAFDECITLIESLLSK